MFKFSLKILWTGIAELFSWKYLGICAYIFVVTAVHILKYFPVGFACAASLAGLLGVFTTAALSRSEIARRVLLVTAPDALCRTVRFGILSFATAEGIFRPIIQIAVAFVEASQCSAGEVVGAGQSILRNIMQTIASRAPLGINKISEELQKIFHPTVEQVSLFFTDLIESVGLGSVPNPISELKKEVTFSIRGHVNASLELKDDNFVYLADSVQSFVQQTHDLLDIIQAVCGVVSIFYIMLYLPYIKYKQLQLGDYVIREGSFILRLLKQLWLRLKGSFNPVWCLSCTLVVTFVVEFIMVSAYSFSKDMYDKAPPSLKQNSNLTFQNNGSSLGNVFADGLNDLISTNMTDEMQVNVTACYKADIELTSPYVYTWYLIVILSASLTYLVDEYLENIDEVVIFLFEPDQILLV